ncbi:hypothetical protein N9Z27_00250 [Alphaproteobacteria bacterium]|nr:hypothetical protein [Alphaproteobacteria bacterium]
MRQQYHTRKTGRGTLVWNVNKLVELVEDLPIKEVVLTSIRELHEDDYWYNEDLAITPKWVADHAQLIAECDLHYPIILCAEGRLMDWMHRVCKAYMQGQDTIKAVQFEETPKPDYVDVDFKDLPYDD